MVDPYERLLYRAECAIGNKETSENNGPQVSIYWKFLGFSFPVAWCAAFVSYQVHMTARDLGIKTNYPRNLLAGSCSWLYKWAQSTDKLSADPKPGYVFLIKSGNKYIHTGFVQSVNGNEITTIEGNTNLKGSVEGDRVMRRKRPTYDLVFIDPFKE